MALFLSTYTNKVDKKGRVSVPAPFRAVLSGQNFSGIVAYPSFVNPCIEACGMDRLEALYSHIDTLEPFSEEREAFATSILGGSEQLPFDSDGRVKLPDSLIELGGITEQALFVGKGETFEIWEPKAFRTYATRMREIAQNRRQLLGARNRTNPEQGGAQ